MNNPTLIPIDLSKRDKCQHPDIKEDTQYLVLIEGKYYADTFTLQWYGWNFNGVYDAGFQLDWNGLEGLWEIVK